MGQHVDYLNDIHGFPDPCFIPALPTAKRGWIVMHSVTSNAGRATRAEVAADEIFGRILCFFEGTYRSLGAGPASRAAGWSSIPAWGSS